MSRKTPYEMRLETLCLAREILTENANAQRELQDMLRNALMDGAAVTPLDDEGKPEKDDDPIDVYQPYTFTTDDVLEEARKLYTFVCEDQAAPPPAPDGGTKRVHSALPGDGDPPTHPDTNRWVTVLNDSNLHVTLNKRESMVHVWYAEYIYPGTLYSTGREALVHGIFPCIDDPGVLDRVEEALSGHLKCRVRLRHNGEVQVPPPPTTRSTHPNRNQ